MCKPKKYCEGLDCAICDEKEPCIYKIANELEEKLKAKEQECEKLRFPMTDTNYAILTKEEFEQLDQLKSESKEINEKLKEKFSEYTLKSSFTIAFQDDLLNKYKQALQEIKEIAEEKAKVNDWLALEILQKINEVEQ